MLAIKLILKHLPDLRLVQTGKRVLIVPRQPSHPAKAALQIYTACSNQDLQRPHQASRTAGVKLTPAVEFLSQPPDPHQLLNFGLDHEGEHVPPVHSQAV